MDQKAASNKPNGKINNKLKVLIAEDMQVNMTLAKALVTKLYPNSKLFEATNGEEAFQVYLKNKPDIILMDVRMPVYDGIYAVSKIRNHEKISHVHTPIVALSADATIEDRKKCEDVGMDVFLRKPFSKVELKETIDNLLK